MEFLGHLVGEGCMCIPSQRVEALKQYTRPTSKKDLRSFLGSISFYRRYVELLASEKAVLSPSSAKLAPTKVLWTKDMESAFIKICECISKYCV